MSTNRAVIPIQHSRIKSWQPCESCGVKRVKHRVKFPTGPTHRLCDTCVKAVKLH